MDNDEHAALIRAHALRLREHFDSVQIFCTRHIDDDTGEVTFNIGCGPWSARTGAVRAWLIRGDESERCKARRDSEEDETC